MIGLGKLHHGLYLLQTPVNKSSCATVLPHSLVFQSVHHFSNNVSVPAPTQSASMQLWHYTLGHPSFDKFHFLHQYLQNLPTLNKSISFCDIWPLAKQRRLPFPNTGHMCANNFDFTV